MKKVLIIAAAFGSITAAPAWADSAVDTDSMMTAAAPTQHQAIDLPIGNFDLAGVDRAQANAFMATMAESYEAGYRVPTALKAIPAEPSAGLTGLFIPAEFAYRSSAQDSGVDAVTPGRFLSSSVRADYLADTGPAAADKSAVGIRFGF